MRLMKDYGGYIVLALVGAVYITAMIFDDSASRVPDLSPKVVCREGILNLKVCKVRNKGRIEVTYTPVTVTDKTGTHTIECLESKEIQHERIG